MSTVAAVQEDEFRAALAERVVHGNAAPLGSSESIIAALRACAGALRCDGPLRRDRTEWDGPDCRERYGKDALPCWCAGCRAKTYAELAISEFEAGAFDDIAACQAEEARRAR